MSGQGYLDVSAFLVSAISASAVAFFNYGGQAERHYKASANFSDLATDIEECLSKSRRFRPAADIFVQGSKIRFDEMNKQGPRLPTSPPKLSIKPWRLDLSKTFKEEPRRKAKKKSAERARMRSPHVHHHTHHSLEIDELFPLRVKNCKIKYTPRT